MPESHRGRFEWRRLALLAFCATLLSIAGAEALLRWLDVADPPAFEANPQYGYLMQPSQSSSTRGHRFHINQAGFRGADFTLPKATGTFRLAFLGDSITYGGGRILDRDLFVNRVASALASSQHRQVEAINLSVPGWGIQNMAAYVATKGLHDADALIWVISYVDFRRPMQTSILSNGLSEVKPRSRLLFAMLAILGNARLAFAKHIDSDPRALPENVQALRLTLEQVTRGKIPCAVVVVPATGPYQYPQLRDDLGKFRAVAESLSVAFMDASSAVQTYGAEEIFFDGAHLTARGHQVVADLIVGLLQRDVFRGSDEPRLSSTGARAPREGTDS